MNTEIKISHRLCFPPRAESSFEERLAAIEQTISTLFRDADKMELRLAFRWLREDYPELANTLAAVGTHLGDHGGNQHYSISDTERGAEFLESLLQNTVSTDLIHMVEYITLSLGDRIILEYIPESEDVAMNLENNERAVDRLQTQLVGMSAALLESDIAQWRSGDSYFLLDGATLWLLDEAAGDRQHGYPLASVEQVYIDPEEEYIELEWPETSSRVGRWLGLSTDRPEKIFVAAGDDFETVVQGFENLADELDHIDLVRR